MLSRLSKVILLVSSFSPLLIVFALLDYWGKGWPSAVCVGLAILSWIGVFYLYASLKKIDPTPLRVKKADRKDQEILTYLAANLLPFLSINPDGWREILASFIFVGLIGLFFVRGELYYTNPVLGVAKFRVLAIETTNQTVYLITRRVYLPRDSEIRAVPISNHIMWEAPP
ncbi:hypothetical protein GCM10023175_24180 [Pseudonocardia xishanensis]|uniref:PH (Pleckstrin Homology) domain-containing protein n=1 Tax=Pseudonocardia xishanensis TaxID=630995 RepID=A0ABP8RRW7_9PSEU